MICNRSKNKTYKKNIWFNNSLLLIKPNEPLVYRAYFQGEFYSEIFHAFSSERLIDFWMNQVDSWFDFLMFL